MAWYIHSLLAFNVLALIVQEGLFEVPLAVRTRQFEKAKLEIEEFQKKYPGLKFGINQFSFMTEDEKAQYRRPQRLDDSGLPDATPATYDLAVDGPVPESLDYRALNQVTSVKNQGPCASCYIFASTGAVESQYLIHGNESIDFDLSEEYVVQCDNDDYHCKGAPATHGERYVYKLYQDKGVVKEECDKYKAQNGTCPISKCQKYKIAGTHFFGEDESKFASYLAKYGPASLNIYTPITFDAYSGGIFDETNSFGCLQEKNNIDHAVLLVGYTPTEWIFKNSYDTTWGEAGYFRVKRGINWCGMAINGVYAPYLDNQG